MHNDMRDLWKIVGTKFDARLVGGCVRDLILEIPVSDYDFATIATPDEMVQCFNSLGIKIKLYGMKHGTVVAIWRGKSYEFTTLRIDEKCYGRHADVSFVSDWKTDASRRDFTFNALYMDFDGNIFDFFGGQEDLQNGQLKFIGSADERIKEDYLRILRAFRFYGRYCKIPMNDDIKEAIRGNVDGLRSLSGERIQKELSFIFGINNCFESAFLMQECDVWTVLLGRNIDLKKSEWRTICRQFPQKIECQKWLIRLALFLKFVDKEVWSEVALLWRLSRADSRALRTMVYVDLPSVMDIMDLRRLVAVHEKSLATSILMCALIINNNDDDKICQTMDDINALEIPDFPISGNMILSVIKDGDNGRKIGRAMEKARGMWLDSGCHKTKDEIMHNIIDLDSKGLL